MNDILIAILSSFWLGMLTVIHPCPLATNVSALTCLCAVSTIKKRIIIINTIFVLGRILSFSILGILITQSIFSIKGLVDFLSHSLNRVFGILLILSGMVLSGLLFNKGQILFYRWMEKYVKNSRGNLVFTFMLGVLTALLFCPATAAIFFGILIPLCIKSGLVTALPVVYSIGSAFPIVLLEIIIVKGLPLLAGRNKKGINIELLITRISGWALILVGIYITLQNVFHII